MIYFHIPGFRKNLKLNLMVIDYWNRHPERFYDNVKIGYVFDSFSLAWNGGRPIFGDFSIENAEKVLLEFKKRDIKCCFTFTNSALTKEDLCDKNCNSFMKIASGSSIIINSCLLEQYLRANYPGYNFILSTTCCHSTAKQINEDLHKDYELVVLDYNMNHNLEELQKIEQKERCEILVNSSCEKNCERRREHFEYVSKMQLEYIHSGKIPAIEWDCCYANHNYFQFRNSNNFISMQDIQTIYEPMGFCHFKLEGRGSSTIHLLEQYMQYFVKDTYRDQVRYEMLKGLFYC